MSDYTPTTDEVFNATLYTWVDWKGKFPNEQTAREGFDRWLAAHDAEVLTAAGVTQPEPEYEYRCVHPSPDVTVVVRSNDWEAHSRKCPGVIERRIKAGDWEPVPNQTGETP